MSGFKTKMSFTKSFIIPTIFTYSLKIEKSQIIYKHIKQKIIKYVKGEVTCVYSDFKNSLIKLTLRSANFNFISKFHNS